jgi:hypothetical protein
LRKFLALTNGVPSEKTFLRVFRVLDPKQFESAFRRWVGSVVGALSGNIAVDGKTVRGSGGGGETAIHMVSAFATDLGIVLGQEKVSGKSNETAIPELLEALYLKGFLVSIDAMGCQKKIAAQITDQGGDYLLAHMHGLMWECRRKPARLYPQTLCDRLVHQAHTLDRDGESLRKPETPV